MKRYELINPSDKIILSCEDDLVAACCALVLGRGRFALCRCSDEVEVLPLLFGTRSETWLKENGIEDLAAYLDEHCDQAVACLESVFYGSIREIDALESALSEVDGAARVAAMARYNNRKRSSLNDIGAACHEIATLLRERKAAKVSKPAASTSTG